MAESSLLACIINRCTEGFLSLSKLNVNDTAAQGAPLTLGDRYAYWHSPHRRVQSDRITLRRFIYPDTDTCQWQRAEDIITLCKTFILFCRWQDKSFNSSYFLEHLVVWGEYFYTRLILLCIIPSSSAGRTVWLISKHVCLISHSCYLPSIGLPLSPYLTVPSLRPQWTGQDIELRMERM